MHEYERQWSRAGGHAVRHPLRLKMELLKSWCQQSWTAEQFEATLHAAQASEDIAQALLAEELLPLWQHKTPLLFSEEGGQDELGR